MINVLHVIPSVSLTQGGPSYAIRLIERASELSDVDTTVVTTNDEGAGRIGVMDLEKLVCEDGAKRLYFYKQTEFYKCSAPMRQWLRRNIQKFDVVHVHALFSFSSTVACRAARAAKVPYLIRPLGVLSRYGMTQRRQTLKRLSFRFIEAPLIRDAASMHYTAEAERLEAEALGITTRAAVVPLGIDCKPFLTLPTSDEFLARCPRARGRKVVLFLSRLDPKKGLDLLLPAFAQTTRACPEAVLVIAGRGDDQFESGLRAQVETLKLGDSVIFAGFVDGELKRSAFAAATAFVLPSYSENFGIAAVEALAAGLPSIISDQTAVSKDILEYQAGIVVPCMVDPLTAALTRVLMDAVLRTKLASNARRLASERFSLEAMGRKLKALYEDILAKRLHPGGAHA